MTVQQEDPFYKTLPFTLPPNQSEPDFVIFGTGLQECALAAYLSKMQQKKGIIFDLEKTYGSCLKTVTLKQLNDLTTNNLKQKLFDFNIPEQYKQKNAQFFKHCTQNKALRGYNIDIQPCFFYGSSITCQCLKQAQMDKYMDFRLVYNMLSYQKGKLTQVPLSKGKIFQSKQLSLSQKKMLLTTLHSLIKIFHRYMKIQEDQNSTKEFDKGFGQVSEILYKQFQENLQNYFLKFIIKLTKNNKKIINYLAYIICNYQYNINDKIPEYMAQNYKLKGFIQKFGKFIMSCGIYGEGPYLYVDNGIGDIPQAFSRIASIFGSTYILHPKLQIHSISQLEQCVKISSNVCPQKYITCKKVYYGPTYTNFNKDLTQNFQVENVFRLILLCKKLQIQQECPSLAHFLDLQQFQNPVYLFMFDSSSHSCPKEYILYQFETIVKNDQNNSTRLQCLVKKLEQIRGEKFRQSIRYCSSFIRKRQYPKIQSYQHRQILMRDTAGIDLDKHFQNFIEIVGKKQNYFRRKHPNQQDDQDQDQFGNQTNNLLQKLQQIDIHNKNNEVQILKQQTVEVSKNECIQDEEDQNTQKCLVENGEKIQAGAINQINQQPIVIEQQNNQVQTQKKQQQNQLQAHQQKEVRNKNETNTEQKLNQNEGVAQIKVQHDQNSKDQ